MTTIGEIMKLEEYLDNVSGKGVMATSDSDGKVNIAVYSKPHFAEEGSLAFIMRDRLSHHNLQSNPHAAYMFVEQGSSYKGIRLHLEKIKESRDEELIASMTRRNLSPEEDKAAGEKFLVYFSVDKVLPLIGGGDSPVTV